jgi:hypothetical protein
MTDNPWANPPPANGARLDHLKSSVVAIDFCKSNIGSGQNREDTLVRGNAEKQRNGYALPF